MIAQIKNDINKMLLCKCYFKKKRDYESHPEDTTYRRIDIFSCTIRKHEVDHENNHKTLEA